MAVTAHNSRRPWGGASLARNVSPGYEPRVSLYQMLHPEQYPKEKQCQPTPLLEERHGMILTYLLTVGPGTAPAMEAEFGLRRDAIGGVLRLGIPGIVMLRQEKSPHTRRMCAVWGLQDIHTDGDDE